MSAGSKWSHAEDELMREAIQLQPPAARSWVLVRDTLWEHGYERTVAMCRNRWSRMNAVSDDSKNSCAVCGFFPKRGHTCAMIDLAAEEPSDRPTAGPMKIVRHTAHGEGDSAFVVSNIRYEDFKVAVTPAPSEQIVLHVRPVYEDGAELETPCPAKGCPHLTACPLLEGNCEAPLHDGVAAFRFRFGKHTVSATHHQKHFALRVEPAAPADRLEHPDLWIVSHTFKVITKLPGKRARDAIEGEQAPSTPSSCGSCGGDDELTGAFAASSEAHHAEGSTQHAESNGDGIIEGTPEEVDAHHEDDTVPCPFGSFSTFDFNALCSPAMDDDAHMSQVPR